MLNIISQPECWITSPNYSLLQLCLHLWCFYLPCQLVPFLAVLLFFPFKQTSFSLWQSLKCVLKSGVRQTLSVCMCVCVCTCVCNSGIFSYWAVQLHWKAHKSPSGTTAQCIKGETEILFFHNFSWMNHKVAIMWHIFLLKNWPCCASRQQNSMKEPYRHSLAPNNHVYLIYTNMPGLTI